MCQLRLDLIEHFSCPVWAEPQRRAAQEPTDCNREDSQLLFLASYLSVRRDAVGHLSTLLPAVLLTGLWTVLLLLQPDLGSAIVVLIIAAATVNHHRSLRRLPPQQHRTRVLWRVWR